MASRPFGPSKRIEQEYERAIRQLLADQLSLATVGEHDATLIEFLTQLAIGSPSFAKSAEALASRVIGNIQVGNAQSWRAAALESLQGKRIYGLLQQELAQGVGNQVAGWVRENASLIRDVPARMALRATEIAASGQQQGLRAGDIAKQLRRVLPAMAESRIRLIARTETGKAESAVTQARAQNLGLDWYIWRTSEDGRVRASHRLMDGVLVNWNDPPAPEELARERSAGHYAPGRIYNCRCISLPLVDLAQISWPRRVYRDGEIRRETRIEFARFMRSPVAA